MQRRVICVKNFPTHLGEKDIYNLTLDLFQEFGSMEFDRVCKQSQDQQYSATICFKKESAAKVAVDEFKRNPKHLGSPKGPLNVNWDNTTPVPIAIHMPKKMPRKYAPQGLPKVHQQCWNKTKREDIMPIVNPPTLTQTPPNVVKTVADLKARLTNFLSLDQETQRQILGELLFPLVKGIAAESLAPKITGMLIDLSVLEVSEILEFLEDSNLLKERVQEATELIESEGI